MYRWGISVGLTFERGGRFMIYRKETWKVTLR